MSDIAAKVKAIIVDKLGVDESEVTNDASFTNDLGADSSDTKPIRGRTRNSPWPSFQLREVFPLTAERGS